MLRELKEKMEAKKAKSKAIAESKYWREHPLLQDCLQAMRGSCTLAPVEMHEAAIAAANIAIHEDNWKAVGELPRDFITGTVYIVWDDAKLPVLKAPWELVIENLEDVLCVNFITVLVAETMDRIVWIDSHGTIKLYSIA